MRITRESTMRVRVATGRETKITAERKVSEIVITLFTTDDEQYHVNMLTAMAEACNREAEKIKGRVSKDAIKGFGVSKDV